MFGIKINKTGRFERNNTFLEWNDRNGFYGVTDKVVPLFNTVEEAKAIFPELRKKYICGISIVDENGNEIETIGWKKTQAENKDTLFEIFF